MGVFSAFLINFSRRRFRREIAFGEVILVTIDMPYSVREGGRSDG